MKLNRNILYSIAGLMLMMFTLVSCQQKGYHEEALGEMKVGDSYAKLLEKVGKPTKVRELVRWHYEGGTEVLLERGKVCDFQLSAAHNDLYHKPVTRHSHRPAPSSWARVKIGIDSAAVLSYVGRGMGRDSVRLVYYRKYQQIYVSKGMIYRIERHAHATMAKLDRVRLNFTDKGILVINMALALIMFGIALELRFQHFVEMFKRPKSFVLGIVSQFFLLPFFTFLFVLLLRPTPSVAMGLILVAACPGGNISNFISSVSRANVALSIGLTSFSTIAATVLTPLNFSVWGSLYFGTSGAVLPISIDLREMTQTVLLILGLPVSLGITFQHFRPKIAAKLVKPIHIFGFVFFIALVAGAFTANVNYFLDYIHLIIGVVFLHNFIALSAGYSLSSLFKTNKSDRRTITIETGIQNSALGLVFIFNPKLFDGLGGMAFIAAWWGIWHIVTGFGLAWYWNRHPCREGE